MQSYHWFMCIGAVFFLLPPRQAGDVDDVNKIFEGDVDNVNKILGINVH